MRLTIITSNTKLLRNFRAAMENGKKVYTTMPDNKLHFVSVEEIEQDEATKLWSIRCNE